VAEAATAVAERTPAMAAVDAAARVQAVAVARVARVAQVPVPHATTAMIAMVSSSPHGLNLLVRHKARDVVAAWAVACRNSPLVMPTSHVSHALPQVSQTRCAPAWT
jgi:hypothetical protein